LVYLELGKYGTEDFLQIDICFAILYVCVEACFVWHVFFRKIGNLSFNCACFCQKVFFKSIFSVVSYFFRLPDTDIIESDAGISFHIYLESRLVAGLRNYAKEYLVGVPVLNTEANGCCLIVHDFKYDKLCLK